ncbi:MAG TPA: radical SAM protein [Candidatus Hydrogenedentes bacterium]|mgnify:FL=1|nr:radical SAM protein [Candidatus Hydrogenedentota bacterium]
MRCPFCATETRVETMTPDVLVTLLDALARAGTQNLVLGGGEPAEWPWGWQTACHLARERGFFVQLGTAGAALDPSFERVTWVDRFVLPLDGDTSALHNRFRPMGSHIGVPPDRAARFYERIGGTEPPTGHFAVIMDRLAALADVGREVTLSTVVNRESLDNMDRLAALVCRISQCLPVHAWHLYRFISSGRGGERTADRFSIAHDTFDGVVTRTRALIPAVRIFKRSDMRLSRDVDFFWLEEGGIVRGLDTWQRCVPVMIGATDASTVIADCKSSRDAS